MQPTNGKIYQFYRPLNADIEQHRATFNVDPSWSELSATIKQLFNVTIFSNNQFIYNPVNGPRQLLCDQASLDTMLQNIDPNAPRVITIKRIRMPHDRYTAQTREQAPRAMKTSKNDAKIPVGTQGQGIHQKTSTNASNQYYEKLAQRFRNRSGKESFIAKAQEFFANPEKYTQNLPDRIPLERLAVYEPTDSQIIFWSIREGIAQRLGVTNPSDNSQFTPTLMARLRALYQACLEKWKSKNNLQ